MTAQVQCVVIGAGVVGLAAARELALRGQEVLVLEAESAFGTHTSSRNSEVIHVGIYYPENSLKARTCVRGRAQLYAFCERHGVEHRKTGKLIVATSEEETATLQGYGRQALANGVDDLELLSKSELQRLEPEVEAEGALWSPSSGIVDSHGLMLALLGDLETAGGTLVTHSRVKCFRQDGADFELEIDSAGELMRLRSRTLVNAAGHGALPLEQAFNQKRIRKGPFAAGHYFSYSGKAPFDHLVYPVAKAGSLGIHATLDLGGQIKFGPDLGWRDHFDYSFGPVEARKQDFVRNIRKFYPALDEDRLQAAYVGIRPRISGPGEPLRDFIIAGPRDHQVDGLVHLLGIESPGLTACLAIAELVAEKLLPSVASA
jgi:L-2-hydroxyglutarate oxidase LhgO